MKTPSISNQAILLAVGCLLLPFMLLAKVPPVGGLKASIDRQILGSWKIDEAKMLAALKAENGGKMPDEETVAIVNSMARGLMFEFLADGLAHSHHTDRREDLKYEILSKNRETGELILKVSPPDEQADHAKCWIDGDIMVMAIEKSPMKLHLRRLRPDEAKAHLNAVKNRVPGG